MIQAALLNLDGIDFPKNTAGCKNNYGGIAMISHISGKKYIFKAPNLPRRLLDLSTGINRYTERLNNSQSLPHNLPTMSFLVDIVKAIKNGTTGEFKYEVLEKLDGNSKGEPVGWNESLYKKKVNELSRKMLAFYNLNPEVGVISDEFWSACADLSNTHQLAEMSEMSSLSKSALSRGIRKYKEEHPDYRYGMDGNGLPATKKKRVHKERKMQENDKSKEEVKSSDNKEETIKNKTWLSLKEVTELSETNPNQKIWCIGTTSGIDFLTTAQDIKNSVGNFDWNGVNFCLVNESSESEVANQSEDELFIDSEPLLTEDELPDDLLDEDLMEDEDLLDNELQQEQQLVEDDLPKFAICGKRYKHSVKLFGSATLSELEKQINVGLDELCREHIEIVRVDHQVSSSWGGAKYTGLIHYVEEI